MSTRGFLGVVIDGTEKIGYNHSDSYPDGLGVAVLGWARANAHALTCDVHRRERGGPVDLARALRVIDPGSEPTDEDITRLGGYLNTHVGTPRERPDWYQLLRGTQGRIGAILAAGAIEDASGFPLDSVCAEYGYLVDLDEGALIAYRGHQCEPHDKGRFARRPVTNGGYWPASKDYYPCAEVARWPLGELPMDDAFVAAIEESR